jgi:hypothetical protein
MPDRLGASRGEGSEHILIAPCQGRILSAGGLILVERQIKTAVEAKQWVDWACHDYRGGTVWRVQIIDYTGALREFTPDGSEAPVS